MTKPIVLSLGEILWDMLPSGKRAGGAPVNFAYHAMMNGVEGYAASAVGEDELGDELLDEAQKAGIHAVIQRNAWPTSTVEVTLRNGIPEYTIVKGVAWDHIAFTRQLIKVVKQADAICFGTLALRSPESHDTIVELLKHAKPNAMKFFDINLRGDHYSKELIEELLDMTATRYVRHPRNQQRRGVSLVPRPIPPQHSNFDRRKRLLHHHGEIRGNIYGRHSSCRSGGHRRCRRLLLWNLHRTHTAGRLID